MRVHAGIHDAQGQGVDLHAGGSELPGQGPGEGVDGALGGAVGHLAGGAAEAPDGGDVQDFSPAGGHHVRHEGVAGVVEGGQVDPEKGVPFLRRHLRQQADPGNGGVVDQDVHGAEAAAEGLHKGQVPRIAEGGKTKKIPRLRNQAGGLLQGGPVGAAVQYDFMVFTGPGAGQRDGPADAPGGAGDQDGSHISKRRR